MYTSLIQIKTLPFVVFKNILVPYDGSKPAIRAFKIAMDIAKRNNSRLKIVSFIGDADVGAWYVDVRLNKEIMKKDEKFTKEYLSKLVDMAAKKDIAVSSDIVETSSIVKTLLSFAKTKKLISSSWVRLERENSIEFYLAV